MKPNRADIYKLRPVASALEWAEIVYWRDKARSWGVTATDWPITKIIRAVVKARKQ